MTPADLKIWMEAAMPMLDRCILFLALGGIGWLLRHVPWVRFFAWLAAPSVGSLIFVCSFCLSAQSGLSQESCYKYWNPYILEFAKFLFGTFGNAFMALKAYRMLPEQKPQPQNESKAS
jgi:hypothetical protein